MVQSTNSAKNDGRWFVFYGLAAIATLASTHVKNAWRSWTAAPSQIIPDTVNVASAAQPVLDRLFENAAAESPGALAVIQNNLVSRAIPILGAASIGAAAESAAGEGMLGGIGAKISSAAGTVFGFAWNNLSWTGKIAGALGIAYLVNRFWKGNSGVTINNTNHNNVKVDVVFKGMDAPSQPPIVKKIVGKDGTSVSVTIDVTPKKKFQELVRRVIQKIRDQKALDEGIKPDELQKSPVAGINPDRVQKIHPAATAA